MTSLNIKYFLSDSENEEGPTPLGAESLSGITETLLPDFSPEGHAISITKFFEGQQAHRWQVISVDHSDPSSVNVHLKPRENSNEEEFLYKTHSNRRRVISNLRQGTFVEVDFGYIPAVKKANGDLRSNKRYPDTINRGEMHKRRLCIVVNAKPTGVQVVPITSQPQSDRDLSTFLLSHDSLSELTNYNNANVPAYALCSMIETVATTRILPPRSFRLGAGWQLRDTSYRQALTKPDKRKFSEALAHSIGCGDYYKTKDNQAQLYQKLKELEPKYDQTTAQIQELTEKLEEQEAIKAQFNALREVAIEWHMNLGISAEEATTLVNNKIEDIGCVLDDIGN